MFVYDTAIIGGGASGLFAGSMLGKKAIILEKGETSGRKLLLSGGGKCNFTHDSDPRQMLEHYTKPRFVAAAIHALPPKKIKEYFQHLGIESYTTDEGKVFPTSNNASDIVSALEERCNIKTNTTVMSIARNNGVFQIETNSGFIYSYNLILATGGKSYSHTGSDGSGYKLAQMLGHKIIKPSPALAPIKLEPNLSKAEGISKDITLRYNKKDYIGDIVITRNGISGPLSLDISYMFDTAKSIQISFSECNVQELRRTHSKSMVKNALSLPERLSEALLGELSNKRVADLTKKEEILIETLITKAPFTAIAIDKGAMTTHGGVDTSELDSKTMQSKLVDNLYIVGDLVDVDANCGGYSLSWAFASAYIATQSIIQK